jgi:isoleucyl-tRNA synthetase
VGRSLPHHELRGRSRIVGELLKFAESGQLYRGAKPVMWSPVEKTALAEAEVEYEEIVSTQIDVDFRVLEAPNCPAISRLIAEGVHVYAVVWTTTPWTIPVNQALAYSPTAQYRILMEGGVGRAWVIADELWEQVAERAYKFDRDVVHYGLHFEPLEGYPGGEQGLFIGSEWEGAVARHPMHHLGGFFAKPRPFLPGEHVTTDAGTGLVHMAPDHGEEDFDVCRRAGIEPVFAVMDDGRYRDDWTWLGGADERRASVINPKFNAPDGPICSDLREAGALLAASADFRHSYPHSWRSKAKVIYRCTPQWFIPMDKPLSRPAGEGGARSHSEREGEGLSGSDNSQAGAGHNGPTLRNLAVDAIERTRWVPEKSRNRISAMVEGPPRLGDQPPARLGRADRALRPPQVRRLPPRPGGQRPHRRGLPPGRRRRLVLRRSRGSARQPLQRRRIRAVQDILDVWFDSGSTHVFTIEQRYGEGAPRQPLPRRLRPASRLVSNPRCSKAAAPAAARPMTRS